MQNFIAYAHAVMRGLAPLLLLPGLLAGVAHAADRPHILYILADDLGWQDLGYLGKEVRTPNLDRLAEGAIRLNQFYVQPYSSQTRAALMTGRYPMRYGLQTQSILPGSQYGLPLDERTLPQALKEAGYRTALVGQWRLGQFKPEYRPTHRGFDYHYGPLGGQIDPTLKTGPAGADWWRNDRPVKEEGYATTLLGKDAAGLIAKHDAATPLFLMLAFTAPAAPLQAPREFLVRNGSIRDETRRTYAAMVSALDDAVGMVAAALERRGMLDSTLIVFHSDNGGAVAHKFATGDGDIARGGADNGRVVVGVSKLGGPPGNGVAGASAIVVRLTFALQKEGSTTLTFGGSPSPKVLDSGGTPIGTITYDGASATLTGVSTGGGY